MATVFVIKRSDGAYYDIGEYYYWSGKAEDACKYDSEEKANEAILNIPATRNPKGMNLWAIPIEFETYEERRVKREAKLYAETIEAVSNAVGCDAIEAAGIVSRLANANWVLERQKS